jgi:hypothetical protein
MKKPTKSTKAPQQARTAVLTRRDLASVIGGTGGTIISQNAWGGVEGIQGTGK